jgi:predicted negative regulator of RcsB-dependent stress response
MEYLIGICILAVGTVIGWKYREYTALKMMQEMELQKVEQFVENKKIHIVLEENDGQMFCYEKETSNFMAMGETWDELADALSERYPGKRFVCDEENLTDMGFYS